MAVLYPNLCYNEVCYKLKGTALYVCQLSCDIVPTSSPHPQSFMDGGVQVSI